MSYSRIGDGLAFWLVVIARAAVILFPLGLWKLVEILIWLFV